MDREELYNLFVEETGDENGEVDNNYFNIWLKENDLSIEYDTEK